MNKDEHAARDERQVGPNNDGMSPPHSGKGPTRAASADTPGAFGDAQGRHGKGGVHTADEQPAVFDDVGPKDDRQGNE